MTSTLYCDTRLGGVKRYVFARDPSFLMQIPDEVRKCVGFIGYTPPDGQRRLAGTAFFVGIEINPPVEGQFATFMYLVTAKHVIDKIRDSNATTVDVRLDFLDGEAKWTTTDINQWVFHPDDDTVDVAVFPVVIPPQMNVTYKHIPDASIVTDEIARKEQIGVGDEVFLTGLFVNHYGLRANIPIVRVGNIAAMPAGEKVEVKDFGLIDAYLVEARSIGGLSGSPVFVYPGPLRIKDGHLSIPIGEQTQFQIFYLLGLMHGHYDVKPMPDEAQADLLSKEVVNMGIAIVVPASKILEVLNQPMLKKKRQADEAGFRKQHADKTLPSADAADAPLTSEGFGDVLRQVSRKITDSDSSEPESKKTRTSE